MNARNCDHNNENNDNYNNNTNNNNSSHGASNNDSNDKDGYAELLRRGFMKSWSPADALEPATPFQQEPSNAREHQHNTNDNQHNDNNDDNNSDEGTNREGPPIPPASSFLAEVRSRAPTYHYNDEGSHGDNKVETTMPTNLDVLPTP